MLNWNNLMMLLFCIGMTACASMSNLVVTPADKTIVYSEHQVKSAILQANWKSETIGGEVPLDDIPLLSSSSNLKNYRPNRAYAIGYPYECGGSWQTWNFLEEAQAVTKALNGCLQIVKGREKHVGKKCGALLVVVNKKLLVNPFELPTEDNVPFVMEIASQDNDNSIIYGMFTYEGAGENRPMKLINNRGKQVCEGRYNLSTMQAVLGFGTFEMKCFDGQIEIRGDLSIKKIKLKDSSGTRSFAMGKGRTSDGSEIKFLTGFTVDQFEDYRYLLK